MNYREPTVGPFDKLSVGDLLAKGEQGKTGKYSGDHFCLAVVITCPIIEDI